MVINLNAWYCENWADIETETIGLGESYIGGLGIGSGELVLVIESDSRSPYVRRFAPGLPSLSSTPYSVDPMP